MYQIWLPNQIFRELVRKLNSEYGLWGKYVLVRMYLLSMHAYWCMKILHKRKGNLGRYFSQNYTVKDLLISGGDTPQIGDYILHAIYVIINVETEEM